MPIAVLAFDFDPLWRLSPELVVRWQTVALAIVLLSTLVVIGVQARRVGLRPDDALALAVGAVPGAVLGGRLAYALVRPEAFGAGPASLVDPAIGGLELGGAVAGGMLTATYVASLLGAPVASWARVVALPVLVLLGGGKIAMALGGSGQGAPSDADVATAYLGPGPWGSLAPELPSHPAQLYEAGGALAIAALLAAALAVRAASGAGRTTERVARPDGRVLLVAIAAWALMRAVVSVTWRDPVALGPLPTSGWIAVALAVGCAAAAAALTARRRRAGDGSAASRGEAVGEPAWPDPAARPPF